MQNSKCQFCGSEDFEERRVEYVYRRKGKYLIVRNVPCEVCLNCGERYYPADALLALEQRFKAIHEKHEQPKQTVEVPVEAFAAA
ncbi:MAG: type II toxin-antitoxin system MqsA family antitoxin [candidate division KSB1 bacterium]|nr:type II toxin-antitoxin system MqsA family antitoxin [candidate division KSB1 bacterium]MDZ7367280.1 type II toxin-antitoxin system MqsA family antitoxin [candidate division KSB1 bacterium]MDZ7405881.1 type II toxin-antitoxin system MqsA family antitoxin [candidate division KSB1 bacterium]